MNDKNIFDALRDIDPQWILDAAPKQRTHLARVWVKWGAIAACLCLVVAAALGGMLWLWPDDTIPSVSTPPIGSDPPPAEHVHAFGEWFISKDATCAEAGEETRLCVCGEKEIRFTDLLPHFAGEWVVEKEPTIKLPTPDDPDEREPGLRCQFCNRCGAKLDEEIIPATGSLGLAYAINSDGKTFSVAGIGNCTDRDIIIPENFCGYHVTSVMDGAFNDRDLIKSVTLPETVTLIGYKAFADCGNLKSVILSEGLLKIDDSAFEGCSLLESITLPSTLTTLGMSAFAKCYEIKSIVIPEGVTVLGANVFDSCQKLESITIPKNLTVIGERAFRWCRELVTITLPDGLLKIGAEAFDNCINLQNFEIPQSVTVIGKGAFNSCFRLTSVTVPNGVTVLEANTFQLCYNLESVTLPDGLQIIGDYAFSSCNLLQKINIPSSVTSIGKNAFYDCRVLTGIVLPEGLKVIESGLFYGCNSLESIIIPQSVTYIGLHAFSGCSSLVSIEIPENVTAIDRYAFYNCQKLERVVLHEGLERLESEAFYNCDGLREMIIPNSVQYIGRNAFEGCDALKQVENGVTYVGSWAIEFDTTISEVVVKEGTVGLADRSFSPVGAGTLTRITLPNSLKYIGEYAFGYNNDLQEIAFCGTQEEWESVQKADNWNYASNNYHVVFIEN